MTWFKSVTVLASMFLFPLAACAGEIHVHAGESIQKAIDAAGTGATIHIDAGIFPEHLNITKSIILDGAGWDKTILKPGDHFTVHSNAEKIAFADQLEAAKNRNEQMRLVAEYLHESIAPTVMVQSAKEVTIRGLKISGIAPSKSTDSGSECLVMFKNSGAKIIDCAILGPSNNGVIVTDDSDVQINHSLVAAVWGTGVAVYPRTADDSAQVHLSGSDIRNCYYACVTIRGHGSTVADCRISGAAWHGIRYDDSSPVITGNLIFGNARSGIYASGTTHAVVRDNIFWKNEMDAISCWFGNADTIKQNTIVENLREGIDVLGESRPTIVANLFVDNPTGLNIGKIAGHGDAVGNPILEKNWFWKNGANLQRLTKPEPVSTTSTHGVDPEFIDVAAHNFSLLPDSPAREAGAGAATLLSLSSPWKLQPEEKSIIPKTDTRDFSKWNRVAAIR